ncbi:Fc receptor-like protein 5 isoform X3 [Hyperolius riggenbachi]|uniref:Fc receptor-like protein 5 isoform X3 n=1 Tax=Hyperolius riggenbachi TaxID=752182 RepID=UPI0035A33192
MTPTTILCISASTDTEHPGYSNRPWVTFQPDFRKMFYNETVTIGCLGGKGNQTYTWYKNNAKLNVTEQNFTVSSVQQFDRGNYQCKIGNGERSDQFRLNIKTGPANMRVPRLVFEGDDLTLRCDSGPDVGTFNLKMEFYKDSFYLKESTSEMSLFIGKVDSSVSGDYCCKKLTDSGQFYSYDVDDEETISFAELFSPPELVINPNPIQVGSNMILTCVAKLHPLRASTELQFAFYRDGWHVQGFSSNNYFTILSVNAEDSGDYSCEVRTLTNSVSKMSKLSSIQVQVIKKPVVTFQPNWDKTFINKYITASCEISTEKRIEEYTWYRNNIRMPWKKDKNLGLPRTEIDAGNYQCRAGSSEKSDSVHLDICFAWLILQVPTSIYEGDDVELNCQGLDYLKARNIRFYKDDKMISFLDGRFNSELKLPTVTNNATGRYKCTATLVGNWEEKMYTAEESIVVAELFSPPELRVRPKSIIEGADMTLICHTILSSQRGNTQLLFEFYKNGETVQAMSSSDKYKVPQVQPEDSGNYTCKVQNKQGSVSKLSNPASVQMQGMSSVAFTPNVAKIFTGESMTFTCNVHSDMKVKHNFNWYRDSIKLNETQQNFTIQSASVEDSGHYQCKSSGTHLSEAMRLDVSDGNLLLQAPPIIIEGDDLTLQCQGRKGLIFSTTQCIKCGVFPRKIKEASLRFGKAHRNMTRSYGCLRNLHGRRFIETHIAETFVSVTDTFSYLQLKANRDVFVEGDKLVLSCQAALHSAMRLLRGKTELTFAFYKDGEIIRAFSPLNKYLISSSAEKKHAGNYTCEVKSSTNGVTRMSSALSVDIQDLFSTPILEGSYTKVGDFFFFSLSCDTTCHPERSNTRLSYSFYKDGNPLQKNEFSTDYSKMSNEKDSGNYFCEVSVYVGHSTYKANIVKRSNIRNVLVQVPLSAINIRIYKGEHEMLAGDSMSLQCSTQGTAVSITWFHNNKEIDHILYDVKDGGKLLLMNSIQPHHSGSYQCKATNDFSSITSKNITINVIDPVHDVTLGFDNKDVLEMRSGEPYTLTCSAAKNSSSPFIWLHNGVRLEEISETHEVRDNGKLLYIKSLNAGHGGQYQCLTIQYISTKELKSQSNIINIHVLGNPYLAPSLYAVALVVATILTAVVVYKYRHRQSQASRKQDQNDSLRMESMDNVQGRFFNSGE